MSGFTPPGECPVCGADVPAGAASCPECGSCPKSGWNEDTLYDGIDLPGQDSETAPSSEGSAWRWLTAVGLIALLLYVFVFR